MMARSMTYFAAAALCVALVAADSATTAPVNQVQKVLNTSGSQVIDTLSGGDSATASALKGIFAAVALIASLGVTFVGYKMIYPVLFAASFFFGACFSYDVLLQLFANQNAAYVGFVIGGILAAVLVLYFYDVGIFAIGAVAGAMGGFIFDASFTASLGGENHLYVHYAIVIITAIAGGVAALKLEKTALVIATSFAGAAIFVGALGHFIGGYPTGDQLTNIKGNASFINNVPSSWWGYFAATLVLFALGAYVQFFHTAKNVNHIDGNSDEKKPLHGYRNV
ncbi:hypothetical protein SDRG_05690 [Saprolegnia diclina VS20]|uniref:Transmembrane protein 198 n=1 Tax=Saprolegnia diclina (strain VS20) TaxID=1156394 RepID=T0QS87_SAPDV|nr:hypothetical protein SDRG_05690 [Saprolegnia diclina VS20]EQC36860.1 hypothetical protein SDRG_05690 [Saprolegnia diclina VS20]|eukprot:XP_008609641.1 hypothetical protein SDRG_05690 [Saprolegnia diclina VS20]